MSLKMTRAIGDDRLLLSHQNDAVYVPCEMISSLLDCTLLKISPSLSAVSMILCEDDWQGKGALFADSPAGFAPDHLNCQARAPFSSKRAVM